MSDDDGEWASERTREKNTSNRVHDIKANEIVRHNIIQLFDIFVGECKRTLNHISSEMPVSSVISWPRGKRISNTIPAFSHFASCHSHTLSAVLCCFFFIGDSFIRWLLIRRTSFWQCSLNTIICYWLQWKFMNLLKTKFVVSLPTNRTLLHSAGDFDRDNERLKLRMEKE